MWQRAESPQCVFVLDETALRRPIGGPAVLDAQLGRLMELAVMPSVRLRVVPLDAGAHVGLTGGFLLAELPDGERVTYVEDVARGHVKVTP
ncbi:Scr1 family TA system antitoxin-like transcriptional regulator [Micromonospora sp. NPDC048842]|uniref:Scr1 family TA system antitoxin-like transcriptional regulator n=1 Tax=Micromonospora sp. NPDC048842 TaxID=3154346 RepID=UPI0033C204CC